MVVTVHEFDVTIDESKCDAPVAVHPHLPALREVAGQWGDSEPRLFVRIRGGAMGWGSD
jgi:hypothetical protein